MSKSKVDQTVVRNEGNRAGQFEICERHNERKNMDYTNTNVIAERSGFNVHFKTCDGTYEQTFNKMVEDGTISLHGLPKDPRVFDEMVFDVNSDYFERNGGYEYAKAFFEEAYRLAVKEAGGEEYVIAAVMHADEINTSLTEKYGHDVYHYHLHVVYTPVVDKERKWTTRCKDPTLIGTVKEVIKQVSHSKRWPRIKAGKGWLNSYSLLQDRYFEHMKAAGFEGFERGERGSTAEHLSDLEYKTKKEAERAAEATAIADEKEKAVAALDAKVEKKQEHIDKLNEKITVKTKAAATVGEVEAMGKPAMLSSNFSITADELKKLKALAKKSVTIGEKLDDVRDELKSVKKELETAKRDRDIWKDRYNSLMAEVKDFLSAIRNFPEKLRAFINEHWQERRQQKQHTQEVSL